MAYKTKPELEESNFIVYTSEPDTVVDSAGIGGGGNMGKCSFIIAINKVVEDPTVFDNLIELNGEPLSGFELRIIQGLNVNAIPALEITADAFSLLEMPHNLGSYNIDGWYGAGFVDAIGYDESPVVKAYTPTPVFDGARFTITLQS